MRGTITFTRESLDKYTTLHNEARDNNQTCFIWKGNLINVNRAKTMIRKLEATINLSIPYFN